MPDDSTHVKFSFEGDVNTLAHLLAVLVNGTGSPVIPESHPVIAPLPVSAQQPPPPTPPLHPKVSQVQGSTMESLNVDPVYGLGGAHGATVMLGESAPAPSEYPALDPSVAKGFNFGGLPLDPEAWSEFRAFLQAWLVGFDSPEEEQPERLDLLKGLGSSRWSMLILRWCAHYGSLQGAVYAALQEEDLAALSVVQSDLVLVDRLSANITQVAHAAFPDISGFHDYSTKWSRDLQAGHSKEVEVS